MHLRTWKVHRRTSGNSRLRIVHIQLTYCSSENPTRATSLIGEKNTNSELSRIQHYIYIKDKSYWGDATYVRFQQRQRGKSMACPCVRPLGRSSMTRSLCRRTPPLGNVHKRVSPSYSGHTRLATHASHARRPGLKLVSSSTPTSIGPANPAYSPAVRPLPLLSDFNYPYWSIGTNIEI